MLSHLGAKELELADAEVEAEVAGGQVVGVGARRQASRGQGPRVCSARHSRLCHPPHPRRKIKGFEKNE